MSRKQNIDQLLRQWQYDPETLNVRQVRGDDGRDVIQMRIDMGVLQMELEGRPDGTRPHGYETYYDFLLGQEFRDVEFQLTEEQCSEADREFVQFYHRRICWLALREFPRAVADADHSLALMDFCGEHSPDENWTISHEQYRPFVLFHRTQAAALAQLEKQSPDEAVQEINVGLERLQEVFEQYDAEDSFDDNELVERLQELRESVRDHFQLGRTLHERLADAVAAEQYELAAEIRDELARRTSSSRR